MLPLWAWTLHPFFVTPCLIGHLFGVCVLNRRNTVILLGRPPEAAKRPVNKLGLYYQDQLPTHSHLENTHGLGLVDSFWKASTIKRKIELFLLSSIIPSLIPYDKKCQTMCAPKMQIGWLKAKLVWFLVLEIFLPIGKMYVSQIISSSQNIETSIHYSTVDPAKIIAWIWFMSKFYISLH